MVITYWSNAFYLGLLVVIISLLSLGGALLSQYGFQMRPCILCIYQRWPHAINIVFGLVALFLTKQAPKKAAFFIFLSSLSFFIGSFIAFYHVGVEQIWWQGFEGCSFPKTKPGDFEAFKQALLNAPVTSCKDIPFQIFGISMAGYNALLSFGMAIFTLLGSIFVMRRANNML